MDPQYGVNFNLPWGIFRGTFGGSKKGEVVSQGSEPVVRWPTWSRVFSTGYLRIRQPTGRSPLVFPCHCLSEEEPPFPDGRFDALAFLLLEGLGVREVGVVGTTLEAKGSPEDFEVRLSELVTVNRVEGPRHTDVQQGLNPLGFQRADLQAEPGGRYIV